MIRARLLVVGLQVAAIHAPAANPDLAEQAKAFQEAHLPEQDRGKLSAAFLGENLALAMEARRRFPWARQVPEELFLNDVLPYASLDEPRDPWRRDFLALAAPLVAGCATASEAVQALNREFFKQIGVHYSAQGTRANQSPKESMALGKASCTGLSILLVDACRAVGIPARPAGIPAWPDKEGNHTWVEIWDGGWHFTGADEYDPAGLDRAWFVADAAKADPGRPEHSIYASSWKPTGVGFPLAWSPGRSVPGVPVTDRYARPTRSAQDRVLQVRLWDRRGGSRLVAALELRSAAGIPLGNATTKAGTADLNDMARLDCPALPGLRLQAAFGGQRREWPLPAGANPSVLDLFWEEGVSVAAAPPAPAPCPPPAP
jgi:hypothetical protein